MLSGLKRIHSIFACGDRMQIKPHKSFLASGMVAGCLALFLMNSSVAAWQDDASELVKQLKSGTAAQQMAAADQLGYMPEACQASVPELTRQLSNTDPQVRWRAARALGNLGKHAAESGNALCACCDDRDPAVLTQVALALGKIGDDSDHAVETLTRLVGNDDPAVARAAIGALRTMQADPHKVVEAFAEVVEHDDHAVVIHAVEALIENGRNSVPVINELLKNDRTALWGAIAIESLGPEAGDSLPDLLDMLARTQDTQTRVNGLLAVAAIGESAHPAGPRLIGMFDDLSSNEQAAAVYALGTIGFDDAHDQLATALNSDNPLLAAISAWAGAKLHPDDPEKISLAVDRLTGALKSPDEQLRTAAARALGELNLPPARVVPALIQVANDPDPEVVANVVDALASRGQEVAGNAGQALSNPELKEVALGVIQRLGPDGQDALPGMIEALNNEQGEFRARLQMTIAGYGEAAAAAVPQLLKSLDSPDENVRTSAMYALGCCKGAATAAAPVIEKRFDQASGFEKLAAAWALILIEPQNPAYAKYALAHLPEGLENSDPGVRLECIHALASLGAAGKPALESLKAVAGNDSDPEVRKTAAAAVSAIEAGK